MAELGKTNILTILKKVDFGLYLDGEELGEILLPRRYAPKDANEGDELKVFIYLDSEDRLIATTEIPFAEIGQCAHLKVVSIGKFGAFLDWGLPKDILAPFKEQRIPMLKGKFYTVFLFIDVMGRIAASSKLDSFLKEEDLDDHFTINQKVNLHISRQTELGYKAVINGTHIGLIHNSDLLQKIKVGEIKDGYIKKIRTDGRIDLTLQEKGIEAIDNSAQNILDFIKNKGGSINITDKSSPEIIYEHFKISKSVYKKALGKLYKDRIIVIEKDKIILSE